MGCLVQVLGFADRWVGGYLLVAGAGRAAWSGPGGFRRAGGNGEFPAEVSEPAPDPGGGEPARFGCWAFPRAA